MNKKIKNKKTKRNLTKKQRSTRRRTRRVYSRKGGYYNHISKLGRFDCDEKCQPDSKGYLSTCPVYCLSDYAGHHASNITDQYINQPIKGAFNTVGERAQNFGQGMANVASSLGTSSVEAVRGVGSAIGNATSYVGTAMHKPTAKFVNMVTTSPKQAYESINNNDLTECQNKYNYKKRNPTDYSTAVRLCVYEKEQNRQKELENWKLLRE